MRIPCIITTNDLPKSCRQCLCIVLRMDLPEYAYLLLASSTSMATVNKMLERGASTVRLKLLWGRRCLHKAPRRTVTAPELIVVLTGYTSTSSESCHRGKRPHLVVVPEGPRAGQGDDVRLPLIHGPSPPPRCPHSYIIPPDMSPVAWT